MVWLGVKAGLTSAVVAVAVLAGTSPAHASSAVPSASSTTPVTRATTVDKRTAATVSTGSTSFTGSSVVGTGPSGQSPTPATATPGAAGEQTLSPEELAAQIATAQQLTDDLTRSDAGIAAAAAKLDRLAAQANTLLQAYAKARDDERVARDTANRDVALFQQLSTRLGQDRRALGQWAYQAYAGGGGSLGDMGAMLDVLTKSANEASDTAAQLSYLSDQRTSAFKRVENQTQLQRDVAAQAVEASTKASEAAAKAAEAKKQLDVVVKEQQAQLDATRKLHTEQVAKAGPVAGLLLGSGDPKAMDVSERLLTAAKIPGIHQDGSVKACSTDEGEYPNGQIPVSALCPLYGAPGASLRPAPSAAFNAMSLAYEKDTGQPLCVTDSYRSLAEQVAVKATRGKWAATPGTSEHGLGRAVDLCGGVESFGSAAHLWMKQNAPLYGWFHPDWAEPTGALPEPWHWEFAG
ncbi:D-alanyl-D-alanine carboxypeptidase family protein [Pedococcus sp. 5OH_020]|uniref:D-alanyl-D-alanine carboxypeptidase family protein n=1 Tax=Pedococcus sp. 5OH_020 TaxID=2989814 RepID=UPI0022E9E22C|nr:D-alanyl-D-alanine carboxypeptidase family protein [Pedococcus sp. 5OH_020]